MNEDRWRRIEELYHAARLLNDSARVSFLSAATEGDEELRREVESLLVSGASSPGFLDEPLQPPAGSAALFSDPASLSGRRIGTYLVHERIGAGGMGEVYRARDSKLHRDVALKVLTADLIGEDDQQRPELLRRFRNEAHALAALNHPNIAAIYGLEEADGVTALVMELVDGSTLADRIMQGAIPVEEALPNAKQIAEALEAAHERGIVHRDLKPANIKLRSDGTVKVLDFGLAKAVGPAAGLLQGVSQAATHSAPAVTDAGIIVGTAAYMSPEQAAGKAVDHRTDIWAFGCVLFEMLTGHAAFGGNTLTDTLAAVMRAEPDWSQLPAATPSRIRTLLHRCLDKDTRRRLQAIGEARIVIDNVLSREPDDAASARTNTSRWLLLWGGAALLLVAFAALSSLMGYRMGAGRAVPSAAVFRPNLVLPPGVVLSASTLAFTLSPDGWKLVMVGVREGKTQLYLRSLDEAESRLIDGTAGAQVPFFSPDGKSIGFWADGRLMKVPVDGGAPNTICNCDADWGAAWLTDDVIVFSSGCCLQRVSVQEGHPEVIATRDPSKSESAYESPVALPGGNAVLFSIRYNPGARHVAALSLNTGRWTRLVTGAYQPRFIAPGFVVVNREGTLEVARFDTARLEVGPFTRLGEGASMAGAQSTAGVETVASYDVAAAGRSMVYVKARSTEEPRGVYKIDLHGKRELLSQDLRLYSDAALSPDGNRLAVDVAKGTSANEIWILDLVSGRWDRITSGHSDWQPVWQDDHTLIFGRGDKGNPYYVYAMRATSSATPTRLASFPYQVGSEAVAPDQSAIVYTTITASSVDLWTQPLGRDGKASDRQAMPLVATPANESMGPCGFSPDGHRLAYSSDATGRREIYVTDFPAASAQIPVTNDGGASACWSKDGRQIFYWKGNTVMAVTVHSGEIFKPETPRKLFDSSMIPKNAYDVAKDGTLYVAGNEVSRASPIVFVSDITGALPSSAKAH